jgi:cytidylate kinase
MSTGIHQIIDRQIRRWEVEARARRELAAERPGQPTPVLPWVTISRAFGSGGGEVAQRLSARLNYPIVDKEILEVLVQEGHLRAAVVEALDERDRSSLDVWVDGILRGRLQDKDDYLRTLVRVIGGIAIHGHSVIIGRGANFILDSAHGLNVRIVAPREQRIETIRRIRDLEEDAAGKLVDRIDGERSAYIHRHFHRDIEDPLAYDLILNTAGIGIDLAVELIDRSLRQKLGPLPHVRF